MTSENHAAIARTEYFDYLRVFASLCIMIVHVASYQWYVTDVHSSVWIILNAYKGITRPPVLLFIMISGALFLGRDIPIRKLYGKYVLRMVIAFLFWDVVYALITHWHLGLTGILTKLVNSNYHLWFLLTLIGLYICTPLLKQITYSGRLIRYFLAISFLFAFLIPQGISMLSEFGPENVAKFAEMLGGHLHDIHPDVFLGYPFYYLAGYYIHNYEQLREYDQARISDKDSGSARKDPSPKIIRHFIYFLGIAGAVCGILLNTYTAFRSGAPSDLFHSCFTLHELFEALALFTFFKHNTHGGTRLGRLIYQLSAAGFGAYLIHDLVILGLDRFLGLNAMTFHPLAAVPAVGIITFILSFAISWLLNRIPVINRYLV